MQITEEYIVEGMTCGGCVASVKKKLEAVEGVSQAEVSLEPPMATVSMNSAIALETLQNAAGKYQMSLKIKEAHLPVEKTIAAPKNFETYKPLIIIVLFIFGVSLLSQFPFQYFNYKLLMRHFMAGFFLVFSFFKLLNLSGFASSYSMYDIVAKRWKAWGFIYPFIELFLGICYLTNIFPIEVNIITILVLGVSSIGVIESNLNKREIKCACLGDVFNLPMSTVTIVEDVSMILMAVFMLFLA